MKPWLTYQRVSTDDQAREGVSLDAQREACALMARACRYEVREAISDPGWSGKDLQRPGMVRLLAQVDAGAVAGVIVYKLDRLTRSRRDLEDLLDRFDRAGVGLVSVSEKLDTSSPMGRFFVAMLGAIAQWERETIADRVLMGMRHRKAQGGFVGGNPPAGLRAIGQPGKRTLERHPQHGPTVAAAWPMIVSSGTLRAVAAHFDQHGVPCRGKGWTMTAVQKLLRNERYIGLLVDRATFDRADRVLRARTTGDGRPKPREAARPFVLTGVARCPACSAAFVGVTAQGGGGKLYRYYRCNNRIRRGRAACGQKDLSADRWEPAVIGAMVELVGDDGRMAQALAKVQRNLRARQRPTTEARDRLVMQRDKLAADVGRLVELTATGGMAPTAASAAIAKRQAEHDDLQARIAAIDSSLVVASISDEQLAALIEQMRQNLADLPGRLPAEQSTVLRTLVREAVLKPGADTDSGEVDLAINLPALVREAPFVQGDPVVEHGSACTNWLRFAVPVRVGGVSCRKGEAGAIRPDAYGSGYAVGAVDSAGVGGGTVSASTVVRG